MFCVEFIVNDGEKKLSHRQKQRAARRLKKKVEWREKRKAVKEKKKQKNEIQVAEKKQKYK